MEAMRFTLTIAMLIGCAEPKDDLLTASFVDPAEVSRISMFRSCCGHDYSHRGEHDRSMKHYVHPTSDFGVSNDEMPVYAPFDGRVTRVRPDSRELPCFNDTHGHQVFLRGRGVHLFADDMFDLVQDSFP